MRTRPQPGTSKAKWAELAQLTSLAATLAASNACGSGLFSDDDAAGQLTVSATHHGSPRNGEFQERGERIEFTTDEGWKVTLTTAFVTTTDVQLRNCAGEVLDADMRWGTISENFLDSDLQSELLAAGQYASQELCKLRLTQSSSEQPTIALGGYAQKKGEKIKFYVESEEKLVLDLNLAEYNGGRPFQFTADAQQAAQLVVSRTYDRYFDGIDFRELEHVDLEQIVLDTLRDETRVGIDTHVEASLYEEPPPRPHVDDEHPDTDADTADDSEDPEDEREEASKADAETADDDAEGDEDEDAKESTEDEAEDER